MTQTSTSEGAVRIAFFTDTHCGGGATQVHQAYAEQFERVLDEILSAGVDFALAAGDLTDQGRPEQATEFQQRIRRLNAPVLCVPGNHDVGDKRTATKPGSVTAESVAGYEAAFGASFFQETVSGITVLGVNGPLLGSGLRREEEQWALLEEVLAQASPTPRLLLTHYPLALENLDEAGDPYWNIEPGPRSRLAGLLRQGNVRTALSGHLHRPLVNRFGSLVSVTAPPVSFGLPPGRQPCGWVLVTVNGHDIRFEPRYLAGSQGTDQVGKDTSSG